MLNISRCTATGILANATTTACHELLQVNAIGSFIVLDAILLQITEQLLQLYTLRII